MKLSAMFLTAVSSLGLAGCGGSDAGFFVGTWRGESDGIGLTLEITEEVPQEGTSHLQGTLSSNRLVCLDRGRLAGTALDGAVKLSAHGTGTRSGFTLVDISGQLMGTTIMGTLTMKGDSQNLEPCNLDMAPIVLRK
jgi:hypothetical protein